MTRAFVFIICVISLVLTKTAAQQLSDPTKEEAVKLSGDYYWEEATAKTIDEAKSLSREYLLKKIIEDYNSKIDLNQVKSIQVEGIDYLLYIRGPKYRMIAFIQKKNVTELLENLKEMHSVEILHSDKYPDEVAKSEQNQKDDIITKEIQDESTNESISDNSVSPGNEKISSDTLIEQNSNIEDRQELANINLIKKGQGNSKDQIRKELSNIKDAAELSELINQYKLRGKLVFGRKEAFNNPDKCDIVIINPDTKEAVAYLFQKDNKFINYTTNEYITDFSSTFNGMTTLWIQFFEK